MKALGRRRSKPATVALPGSVYGRLTVVQEMPKETGSTERRVLVRCECGIVKVHRVYTIAYGAARSCGCLRREYRPSTEKARAVLRERRAARKSLPVLAEPGRFTCKGGCNHDGRMAPGGSEDGRERDSKCAHYAGCSLAFVKAHKDARTSHCPKDCPQQAYHTAPEKAAEGWGSFAFPG